MDDSIDFGIAKIHIESAYTCATPGRIHLRKGKRKGQ